MTYTPTNRPVPSDAPEDLYFNSSTLDKLVAGPAGVPVVDRTGVPRKSWATIEADNASLAGDLASGGGAALIGYLSPLAGAVLRSLDKELADSLPITRWGAQPGVDCAAQMISLAAVSTGCLLVPPGSFVANVTAANAMAFFPILARIRLDGDLTVNLAAGLIPMTSQVVINSPNADRIKILGPSIVSASLTSQISVTGSAKNWSVTLGVSSTAGMAVGDFASIRTDVTGTGGFYPHGGSWRITAIGAGSITVTNTYHGATFPTNTVTGGSLVVNKTRVKFTGVDGFRFESASPIFMDRFTIEGDWDVAADTGTEGAHGIVMAAPVITGGASSNAVFSMAGNASLGSGMSINCFGEQGIAVSGRCGLVANFVPSCSHRKRSWYAEGGHIRCKFSVGSGSGEDGYIADTTGFIQAAGSWSAGTGLNSFWGTNGGCLLAANSVSYGPLGHGYEQRGQGRVGADGAKSFAAGISAFKASDGGQMDADDAIANGSVSHSFDSDSGAVIDADNSQSVNSGGYAYRSQFGATLRASGSTESGSALGVYFNREATLIGSAGTAIVQDVGTASVGKRIYNTAKTLFTALDTTSIGDLSISAGATQRWIFKTDGTLHPAGDNTQTICRVTNRASAIFSRQVIIGAGAQIITGGAGSPEGVVTAPVGSLYLRSDGGAVTTLYIKETGTGNTGWVAK